MKSWTIFVFLLPDSPCFLDTTINYNIAIHNLWHCNLHHRHNHKIDHSRLLHSTQIWKTNKKTASVKRIKSYDLMLGGISPPPPLIFPVRSTGKLFYFRETLLKRMYSKSQHYKNTQEKWAFWLKICSNNRLFVFHAKK